MSDGKANRHHSFFHLPPFYRVCLWFLPFALALAVLVLLYIRVDNRLKDELETTLTREFGRRVTVIKPSVSFPMKIDGIIVQGDGSIDTQPFLAMYDIQVWLALSSLFSEKTTVTSMRIESAVISIKHSNTLGWSTNGLFPNPPNEKSAIKTIHFANMSLIVNTSNFHVNENFRARLTSEKFGDFSFTFRGKNKNGTLLRTGANSGEPIAALNINFDSVPYIGPAQQFGIRTKYNLKSGEFDLGLNVLVNQKPFRFESEFKIDTPVINLVGEWNYDSGTGNVQGTLDRQTQQFKVEGIGTVAMKAVGLHANITSGTLDWKQASIEGNFDGPWNIKTSVASTQLNCTTNPFVENLTGDLQMSAQVSWDDGLKLNRINSLRGNVAFDAIKTSKVDLKKGSIRANANRQRINFSGSWKQFDGFFSTKKTTVTLNRTFRPTNFQGKLSLKNVNVAKVRAALKLPIREDFFRFSPNWTFTGNLDAYDETVKGGQVKKALEVKGVWHANDFRFPSDGPADPSRFHSADLTMRVKHFVEGGPVHITRPQLSLDGGRTVLHTSEITTNGNLPEFQLTADRIDVDHIRDLFVSARPDLAPIDNLDIKGGFKGTIQVSPGRTDDEITSYYIDLSGDLKLRNKTLKMDVVGGITPLEPQLIVKIDSFNPQSLYLSMNDIDSSINTDLVTLSGNCAATLTIVGESWEDLNLEGLVSLRNNGLKFHDNPITFRGINGGIPFRLRRAKKWVLVEMTPKDSRDIYIAEASYEDLALTNIRAKSRFNEKSFYVEKGKFDFAGGQGEGALVVDFPDWSQPRLAFFGKAENFDVGVFYTMMPFKGQLAGTGKGNVEFMTGQGWDMELVKLKANLEIDSGIIGSELLKVFVQDMQTQTTTQNITRGALLDMSEWNFIKADLKLALDPDYYDERTAIRKFGRPVRAEVIGDYSIVGILRPLEQYTIFKKIKILDVIAIEETIKVESTPMRLLMERVGTLAK